MKQHWYTPLLLWWLLCKRCTCTLIRVSWRFSYLADCYCTMCKTVFCRINFFQVQVFQVLMLVIICTKYGKNPSRTVDATERTRFSKSRSNDLEDKGHGQRSSHATPSHASDYLYQIWKESIENCRCYRADTIFKAKAKWPWRYRSRSKVIICNTFSHTSDHLYQIWKESIENCRFFFQGQGRKI